MEEEQFLLRHALASLLVAAALAITTGVFVFARPHYAPPTQSKTLDMTR